MTKRNLGWLGFLVVTIGAFAGISPATAAEALRARTGMERLLEEEGKAILAGKKWAVLSHPASRNPAGDHLVDALFARQADFGMTLVSLFSPEHGFRGDHDLPVPDSKDPKTGLPVYSLYGPRRAPTAEHLAAVDGVIVDLQDVGVRYYTFATTMALVMQACKAAGKSVVVLDRPNPIGGAVWEGAILERTLQGGLANFYPIPTVHGLTLGELAGLYNSAFAIGVDLTVVRMDGWKRDDLWRDTGLKWIAPSPALMDTVQTEIYSFLGTLESANLAVGRGITNERAFRIYGAPWITVTESKELVRRLNALALPGISFAPVSWTATRSLYEKKLCRGFEVKLGDFRKVDGLKTLLATMTTMRSLFGPRFDVSKTERMLGDRWIRDAIAAGGAWEPILARIRRDSAAFGAVRARALLY